MQLIISINILNNYSTIFTDFCSIILIPNFKAKVPNSKKVPLAMGQQTWTHPLEFLTTSQLVISTQGKQKWYFFCYFFCRFICFFIWYFIARGRLWLWSPHCSIFYFISWVPHWFLERYSHKLIATKLCMMWNNKT